MKNRKKILIGNLVILLIISSFSSNLVVGDDSIYIFEGEIRLDPISCNLGNFQQGDTDSCSFEISHTGINNPDINLSYRDVDWTINIPDFFKNYISVSPTNGILKPNSRDPKTGEIIQNEENSCTVTVNLDTTGLVAGAYVCDITISYNMGRFSKIFPLKFFIGAYLQYSPEEDSINLGKPEVRDFDFYIRNGGFSTLNYNLDVSCYITRHYYPHYEKGEKQPEIIDIDEDFRDDWVTLSTTSGRSTGETDKITLTVNTSTLEEWTVNNSIPINGKYYRSSYGLYKCEIDISSNGVNNNGNGKIVLTVEVGPEIKLSGNSFNFGDLKRSDSDIKNTTFQVSNKHPGNLTWEILIPERFEPYVNVTPMSGISTGPDDKCTVTVTVDPTVKIPDDALPTNSRGKYMIQPGYHKDFFAIKSNDPRSFHHTKGTLPETNQCDDWPNFNLKYYLSLCNNSDIYDMVIIVADYLKDFPHSTRPMPGYSIEDLAEAHRINDGYDVLIKTVKEIYDEYKNYYYPDGLDNLLLSKENSLEVSLCIREFLRDAYFHWDNESQESFYVLLVGDDDWNMIIQDQEVGDDHPNLGFDGPPTYWENIDAKWLKVGDPPNEDSETGNKIDLTPGKDNQYAYFSWGDDYYWNYSVELPTFQIPVDGYGSPQSSAGDGHTGWKSYPFNLRGLNIQGGEIEVKIQTLYPYTYTVKIWNETTQKYDEIEKIRNLYVNGILIEGNERVFNESVFDDVNSTVFVEPKILNVTVFNCTTMNGVDCCSTNYTNSSGIIKSIPLEEPPCSIWVTFYDHPEDGFDTFIVYVNGIEVGRYDDDGGTPSYLYADPYTSASDMPYACLGEKDDDKLVRCIKMPSGGPKVNLDCFTLSDDDYEPDVIVGRAPVKSAEELENFVRKTIEHMQSPATDEYLNAVVASEWLGLKGEEISREGETFVETRHIFMWPWKNLTIDGVFSSSSSYGGNYNTVGIPSTEFNIIKLHDHFNGGFIDAVSIGWDEDTLVDLINSGVGLINHMGHSDKPSWVENKEYSGFLQDDGIATPYAALRLSKQAIEDHTIVDIDGNPIGEGGLKNTETYPIIFSTACYGGQFDNAYSRQIGELLIIDENGAVAGVFNGMMMPDDEAESTKYDRMFWNAIFGKGIETLGDAFNEIKKDTGNSDSNLYYGLNLLGDPALKIKGMKNIPPIANDDQVVVENNTYDNIIDVLDNDVLPEAPGPILAFNPSSSDFELIGRTEYETSFDVWNHGSDTLDYSISMSCKKARIIPHLWNPDRSRYEDLTVWDDYCCDWIQLSQTTGSSTGEKDTINVTFNTTDLPADILRDSCEYMVYITINSNGETRYSNTFLLKFEVGDDPVVDPVPSTTIDEYNLNSMYEAYVESFTYPLHGTLVINGNLLEYTPDPGYSGRDSFKYTITSACDLGNSGVVEKSDDANVYITVNGVNDPPVVDDIPDQTITLGDSFELIHLDDFVTDPGNVDNELKWSCSGNTNLIVDIDMINRIATITYPPDWNSSETITFTATDGSGLSDSDTATFTVLEYSANYPPVLSYEIPTDGSNSAPVFIGSLSINIADPEGDSFSWSIETSPDIGFASGTSDTDGVKTCSISGLQHETTYTWFVNATDLGSGTTTRAVYTFITETEEPAENVPPVAVYDFDLTDENIPVIIDILENDNDEDGILDPSTVNITSDPVNGDVSVNLITGEVTYIPDDCFVGIDSFTYTVCDDDGAVSNIASVTVFVGDVNMPPVFSNGIPVDGSDSVPVSIDSLNITINDPEGDSFDWTIESVPSYFSGEGTGEFNGTKSAFSMIDCCMPYNTTFVWFVNATDSGSGLTTSEVYTFTTEPNIVEEPTVEIVKPLDEMLYIHNELRRPFFMTFIISSIDIESVVIDPSMVNVDTVRFFLDDNELTSIPYDPLVTSYSFTLSEPMIGLFTIKVSACNAEGDEIVSANLDVLILNLGLR